MSTEKKPINLQDKVTIYATELHKHATTVGEPLIVHPTMAEKLIGKGWATEKEPAEKTKKGGIK